MKRKYILFWSLVTITLFVTAGCGSDGADGVDGQDGQDATVYYSDWFSPADWSGSSGDWYFTFYAPELTADIIERGVVLAYAWLDGDLYGSSSVRPLPAYAVGANWSFLSHEYGAIEITCDMAAKPATTNNYFRIVAIPGTIPVSSSVVVTNYNEKDLQSMSYGEIVELFGIPMD